MVETTRKGPVGLVRVRNHTWRSGSRSAAGVGLCALLLVGALSSRARAASSSADLVPLGADEPAVAVVPVEPVTPTPIDDERVWEDISDGTGEADFTAIAIDPENPRRLYAGAAGSLYVSDDGGKTWTRTLRLRGSANTENGVVRRDRDGALESDVDDRVNDLREELIEELKREITDDLVAELGDFGEQLAEELAEELAEQRLDEESDRLADEARSDLGRRSRKQGEQGEGDDQGERQGQGLPPKRVEPRRIWRLRALAGGRLFAATGSGLYLSTDYGQTFRELSFGMVPAERDVRSVQVHPLTPSTIFAGTLAGLYFSTDSGETWTEASGFPQKLAVLDLAIDPAQPQHVLAATEQGLYRSADGGSTFTAVLQPTSPLAAYTRAVAYDPADPRIVFAGTLEGLFRSLDGGFEWERLEPTGLLARDVQDFQSMEWGLLAASSDGVYLSADSGASFRELYAGLDAKDVRRLAAGPTPLEAWAVTSRGLFTYRAPEVRARKLAALAAIRTLVDTEPTLAEVAKQALAYAQAESALPSWRARQAWAAYLPKVVMRAGYLNPFNDGLLWNDGFKQRSYLDTVPAAIYDMRDVTAGYQVYAVWDAQRILFNESSLDASRAFRKVQSLRQRVLRRVVSTYDARRRLQVALLQSPPADLGSFARKSLQIDELTAVLDALTNGRFSSALASSSSTASSAAAPRSPSQRTR